MGITRNLGLGIPDRAQIGSLLNPFPVPTLQERTTEFEVIQVGADYYFKALKGENFLITNCDLVVGSKGWPYKSVATIDCCGQTGVPVVSLFQNFDFLNQYFTKHIAATFDAVTGAELTPNAVTGLCEYSAPLTGADLTAANTFYSVPSPYTYWLDFDNGNNANNATTKALARKTIVSLDNFIASGTVNVISGNDTDTAIVLNKQADYNGVGKAIIKSTATTNGVIRSGDTANERNVTGAIIDGQNQNLWVGYFVKALNLHFTRCLFRNILNSSYGINVSTATSGNVTFDKCVFNSDSYSHFYGKITEVKNSLIKGASAQVLSNITIYTSIHNNKIEVTIATGKHLFYFTLGGVIENNDIVNAGTGMIFTDTAATVTKSKFNRNKVRQSNVSATGTQWVYLQGVDSEFNDNDIILSGTSISGTDNQIYVVYIFGVTTPSACRNVIDTAAAGILQHIGIASNSVTCGAAKLSNNRILCRAAINSSVIVLDFEKAAAQHHKFDGFEMNDNVVYAPAYFGNGYGTQHTLFAWANSGSMLRNYMNGAYIGLVMKGQDSDVVTAMSYNKIINYVQSFVSKGVSGLEISHNIGDTNSDIANTHLVLIIKNGAYKNHNSNVHHNNLTYRGTSNSVKLIYLDDADNLTGFQSDYNTFYTTQAYVAQVGATSYTFAEWQALGYDLHSTLLSVAPTFDESETLPV